MASGPAIGESIADLAQWAADATINFAREVVAALVEAGKSVLNLITSVGQRALRVMRTAQARGIECVALFTAAASTPRSSSLSDWSFMRAMSGVTTTVSPSNISAGS